MTGLRNPPLLTVTVLALAFSGCASTSEGDVKIQDIHGLALDPNDPSRLYVATHHGLFVGEADKKWAAVTAETFDMMGFTMPPRDGNIMYASGHPNRVGQGWAVGVVRSTDAGRTWTTLGLKNEVDFHAMAMQGGDELTNNTIYGFHGGKLHVSKDGGTTWTSRTLGIQVASLTVSPETGDVWAATPAGIQRNTRFAEGAWQIVSPSPASAIAAGPTGPTLFAYLDAEGLAKSSDRGKSWMHLNWTVPSGDYPWGIAPDPANSKTLYVGTARGSIHKTIDDGTTWSKIR